MDAYLIQVVDYLLSQSWQIAILTVAVALTTFLLRNGSAHVRYLLWLIVLAKCLVPPLYAVPLRVLPQDMPATSLSGSPASEEPEAGTKGEEAVTYVPLVSEVPAAPATDGSPADPPIEHAELIEPERPSPVVQEPALATNTEASRAVKLTWAAARYWLGVAWLIGMSTYLALSVVRSLRTGRWLRRVRKPLPARFQAQIAEFFSTHGFRQLPKIWLAEDIGQPFVWGVLRGSVYLPVHFVTVNSAEQQRSVLGHEVSHTVRFDAAVNLLQVIAQTVFWFHPFVWWANKKIRAEREKSCDEMALAGLHALPKDYSAAIIETLASGPKSARPIPSLAIFGPASGLEERIRTILRPGKKFYKRPSVIAAATVLLAAIPTVTVALVLTARAEAKAEQASDVTATEKTDREEDGFCGPVRVVRIERARFSEKSGKQIEGDRIPSRIMVYDAEGRLVKDAKFSRRGKAMIYIIYDDEGKKTEEREYFGENVLVRRTAYTYDRRGNKLTETQYDPKGVGVVVSKFTYSYDPKGNLTSRATYGKGDMLQSRLLCSYDNKNRKTSEVEYDGEGKVNWRCAYTYDDEGNKNSETWFWIKGEAPSQLFVDTPVYREARKCIFIIDSNGNVIERKFYAADGSLHMRHINTYDGQGNWTRSIWYDGKGLIRRSSEFTYDSEGKLIGEAQEIPPDYSFRRTYAYDDKGNLVETTSCEYEGDRSVEEKSTWDYEYDPTGNWTKETTLIEATEAGKAQPVFQLVIYRTIAYSKDFAKIQELQARLPEIESDPPDEVGADQIQVRLYTDRGFGNEHYFFDSSGTTLPKTLYYTVRCTNRGAGVSTAFSGGLYDAGGKLILPFAEVSTDESGWYRGSYEFQQNDTPGVGLIKVNVGESDDVMLSVAKPFHLYPGAGVSSYKMDFNGGSFSKEYVLENKYLIAVFGNAKISNRVLLYLYQKDTRTSYSFGKTNMGRFDCMYNRFDGFGEVTSNQSIQRTFSCNLPGESENLSKASATVNVNLVYPLNEISHGAYKKLSIWEKRDQSDYERVWAYTPDTFEAADHAVGDADNDGKNEIVWVTSGGKGQRGRVYITELTSGTYQITWTSEHILGYQPRVKIGDTDNDRENEIAVASGGNGEIYIFEYNGTACENVACKNLGVGLSSIEVGDFNKDGENEIVSIARNSMVFMYKYNGTDYDRTANYVFSQKPGFGSGNSDAGDIDKDGYPELITSGASGNFAIIDYSNGAFNTTYEANLTSHLPIGPRRSIPSCALGDPDNDGHLEIVLGVDKRLVYYECASLSEIDKTWESTEFSRGLLHNMIDIEDGDSDGLNEILFIKPSSPNGPSDPSMWGNRSGGPPFTELWMYDTLTSEEDPDHMHGLDTDSDGYKTNLTATITLPSEDADWLAYRVHSMKVDPNIHLVFPILSGSIGSTGVDDRYHLENGSDDLAANLKPDTWNNISCRYCAVYDNSTTDDAAKGTVLAWVRLKESENVKFQDVGLWNDSKGKAASRIRYDIRKAAEKDWFSYLLVFSRGDRQTIDRWLPALKSGKLPRANFMTGPAN